MLSSGVTLDLIFVLSTIIGYLVYKYKKKYEYWRKLNVPSLGFKHDLMLTRRNRTYTIQDRYNALAPHPYGGVYQAGKPILFIRDPEIIKNIFIKDFSHFTDRGDPVDEELDPLSAHMFSLTGQRWKSVRTKLVPTFSSGKLKSMYPLMKECTNTLNRYLEEMMKESPEFDARELMLRFATDVIGTCAFGFNCNAIADDNSEFRRIGRMLKPNMYKFLLRFAIMSIHPGIVRWLKWKLVDQEAEDFFMNVTRDTIKHREENQNKRNDFMQLLINVQHEEQNALQAQNSDAEPIFTEGIVTAQVFLFFLAGFETTASTLSYCLYELALQPDIMEKVYDEILQVSQAHDGKLDYEALKELRYMECVVSETLRKYPPIGFLNRICTKAYESQNSPLIIKENTNVLISNYALHMDPQYFPEPHKFDPYRFSEENKSNIVPGTYLPFGDGPRICIGTRFALMEIRSALSLIIKNYTVHPTAKTPIPVVFRSDTMFNCPVGGIPLRFQKRAK